VSFIFEDDMTFMTYNTWIIQLENQTVMALISPFIYVRKKLSAYHVTDFD